MVHLLIVSEESTSDLTSTSVSLVHVVLCLYLRSFFHSTWYMDRHWETHRKRAWISIIGGEIISSFLCTLHVPLRYELCSFFLHFPFPHIITVNIIFSPSKQTTSPFPYSRVVFYSHHHYSIAMYFFVYLYVLHMPTQHLHLFPFGTPDMSHLLKTMCGLLHL